MLFPIWISLWCCCDYDVSMQFFFHLMEVSTAYSAVGLQIWRNIVDDFGTQCMLQLSSPLIKGGVGIGNVVRI